jgi:hypothetical protein
MEEFGEEQREGCSSPEGEWSEFPQIVTKKDIFSDLLCTLIKFAVRCMYSAQLFAVPRPIPQPFPATVTLSNLAPSPLLL